MTLSSTTSSYNSQPQLRRHRHRHLPHRLLKHQGARMWSIAGYSWFMAVVVTLLLASSMTMMAVEAFAYYPSKSKPTRTAELAPGGGPPGLQPPPFPSTTSLYHSRGSSSSSRRRWHVATRLKLKDDDEGRQLQRRKRDVIRHCWGSSSAASGGAVTSCSNDDRRSRRRRRQQFLGVATRLAGGNTRLNAAAGDGDDHDPNSGSNNLDRKDSQDDGKLQAPSPNLFSFSTPEELVSFFVTKWRELVEQGVGAWWNQVKYILVGFVAGAVLCLTAIFVPVYSQVETLSQPVTLFETILGDLESAYVDEVDVEKLLETSVSAMLRSLDPYTEFESKQAARDMAESIDGKYAGVGLVIAGEISSSNKNKPIAQAAGPETGSERGSSSSSSPSQTDVSSPPLSAPGNLDGISEASTLSPHKTTAFASGSAKDLSGNVVATVTPSTGLATSTSQENSNLVGYDVDEQDEDDDDDALLLESSSSASDEQGRRRRNRRRPPGIRVVSAFEGYAFDYGLRVGDQLVAVDHVPVSEMGSIDQVRNYLRGEPGTWVTIDFQRQGLDGIQSVTIPRTVVRIRDVKLATLVRPNVGYIQLSGFASETGKEMRQAITYLQQASIDANSQLEGLVLDLRGNPGGLLTSAVDVASLFVPKGSDIVSAKGRGFPGVLYRSRVDPLLDDRTKLAVLVNGQTASAAEIVAGAIQDLDVGVIVGSDRTFGKGLVQNVQELPFDTALKFTVAKYYTPSGRCIQGIKYQEGGGSTEESARFVAKKVADKDRNEFLTRNGRVVKDGGGIEADFKVDAPKASALEVSLLRSGAFSDFASEWSKNNELTSSKNVVDEDTYKKFIAFVNQKQRDGDLQLEELYEGPLVDLKKSLKRSGYMGSERLVEQLQASIVREMQKDFDRYRTDIAEDISQNILARYLPESMLIERSIQNDRQVDAAVKLVTSNKFDRLLASNSREDGASTSTATDGSSFLAAATADGTSRGGGVGWVSSAPAVPTKPSARTTMDNGENTSGFRASLKF